MIRRPPRSTRVRSSAASDVYKRQVYELSGPFMGWLGWPNASAMSWAGWLFATAILIVRGRHRSRDVALFALFLACAVYAGQPETVVLIAMALVVFTVVFLGLR